MKKTILFGLLLASTCSWAQQATTTIREFRLAGPYAVTTPFVADTVDMNGNGFSVLVKNGQKVKCGQPLLKFSMDKIKPKNSEKVTLYFVKAR